MTKQPLESESLQSEGLLRRQTSRNDGRGQNKKETRFFFCIQKTLSSSPMEVREGQESEAR